MNSNEKHVLILTGTSHFFAHFFMLMFPSLALWIREDLGLSFGQTLELGFWMYLLFGVIAIPVGYLGDRMSGRRLLLVMMFGLGVGCFLCGMSTTPFGLTLGLAVTGFFASIYHPIGMALISHTCTNRGQAMGNNGVWGNLGIGLAPVLAGVAAYFLGWHKAYFLYGAVTVVLGVLLINVRVDETPMERQGMAGFEKEGEGLGVYYIILLVCMGCLGMVYRGTVVAIPAHFEANLASLANLFTLKEFPDSGRVGITLFVSIMYLCGPLGQVLGGRAADRLDLRKAYLVFNLIALPAMLGIAFLSDLPLLLVAIMYIIFGLGIQPIENSLVARLTPVRFRSLGYSLKFAIVLGVSAVSVKGVKYILEHGKTADVFLYQCGGIGIAIVLILVVITASRKQSWRNK